MLWVCIWTGSSGLSSTRARSPLCSTRRLGRSCCVSTTMAAISRVWCPRRRRRRSRRRTLPWAARPGPEVALLWHAQRQFRGFLVFLCRGVVFSLQVEEVRFDGVHAVVVQVQCGQFGEGSV